MTAPTYAEFLEAKRLVARPAGVDVDPGDVHPSLFGFQRDLVVWAARKGRAALFCDTGMGKTRMQLEWARLVGQHTLILAPLAVADQTIREAATLGLDVRYARHQDEVSGALTISNYERLDRFDPGSFGAVVLDESSILKAFSGATKKALVKAFAATPYRLCCSATPAPNDLEELCNHADFLGVMSPAEMRSTFFIADNRGQFMRYRLKRHAHAAFYRWLASWAMALTMPSDLGYDDDGFVLPPLEVHPQVVATDWKPADRLFAVGLQGVTERAEVRAATLQARVVRTVELVAAEPGEQWLLWCGLNDEATALTRAIAGAVEVAGADPPETKAERLLAFADNQVRVLVTKPSIAGFGLNLQGCARMAFVGIGDSFETYYQAIRRCWRFGQRRPVIAHIVYSDAEQPIYDNVLRKEANSRRLAANLVRDAAEHERAELLAGTSAADDYEPTMLLEVPPWLHSQP